MGSSSRAQSYWVRAADGGGFNDTEFKYRIAPYRTPTASKDDRETDFGMAKMDNVTNKDDMDVDSDEFFSTKLRSEFGTKG